MDAENVLVLAPGNKKNTTEVAPMKPSQGLLLAFMLLPVVCGADPPQYQEPGDEPLAKLRIVLPRPKLYFVHITTVDATRCKAVATIGWLSGGRKVDENRIGMLGSSPPSVAAKTG
jgi:hypothetical protein